MNKAILLVMKYLNDNYSVTKSEPRVTYKGVVFTDRISQCVATDQISQCVFTDRISQCVEMATYFATCSGDSFRANKWVSEYFRVSGENKQDYIDELNKNSVHKLADYIEIYHKGNISSFAREQGVGESQPSRWLKRESYVINGEVYCKVSKQIKQEQQK